MSPLVVALLSPHSWPPWTFTSTPLNAGPMVKPSDPPMLLFLKFSVTVVLALAVFLDRLWAFYSNSKIDTRALRAQLMKHLRRGNVSDAALLCANTPGPVSAVLLTGL